MKKAFTLIELMVVMAIMASLAAMAIGGYRAFVKGMGDRSALVAVQSLIDMSVQRAEVDRRPVAIYFYDELLQKDDESRGRDKRGNGIAVAVRPVGRVTKVDGELIYDEFADLERTYETAIDASGSSELRGSMQFYLMDGSSGEAKTFTVASDIVNSPFSEVLLLENAASSIVDALITADPQIQGCAFKYLGGTKPGTGAVYGSEFATLTLPDGYFFGSENMNTVGRRFRRCFWIDARGNGARDVEIYCWRADGTVESVGTAKKRN